VSRTDDYVSAQWGKLEFLKKLSQQNDDCPILCAGDVFDYWKATPWLCAWAYQYLPDMITIPGNHDLPMHSLDQYEKSALFLLEQVGRLKVITDPAERIRHKRLEITGVPFGQLDKLKAIPIKENGSTRRILLLHKLIWPGERPPWADQHRVQSAEEILRQYGDQFDLIVTGDNHSSFIAESEGCILVNPGSMLRATADQIDFEPCCYLYFAKENWIESVPFPIVDKVHDTHHLTSKRERDSRLSAYIERMGEGWEQGISFRDRLQLFFEVNKTPARIRDIIWKHLERG
jgi:predicted phosphodiesterase